MVRNALRRILKQFLFGLSRWAVDKHRPTVIAVVGEGKTAVAREAIYTALKDKFPTRRNLEAPYADFALPLTVLGAGSYPTSIWEWKKTLFRTLVQLAILPRYKHVLVLEIGYIRKETFDYFWKIVHPNVLVVCGAAPYLSPNQKAPVTIKVKEPGNLENYLQSAKDVAKALGMKPKDIQKQLANFKLPRARIRVIPTKFGGILIDATYQYFPPDKKAVEEVLKAFPGKRIEISPQNLSAGIAQAEKKRGATVVLAGPYVKMWPAITTLAHYPWS